MLRRIGLIGCSKTKLAEAESNPEKEFPADVMYIGRNYMRSVNEGVKYFGCEDYMILSGKYGLLKKTDRIRYYNCYLAKEKVSYRRTWSQKVYTKLYEKIMDLNDVQFVFFAGKAYYEFLENRLNCITLLFNGQNISFAIKEERSA